MRRAALIVTLCLLLFSSGRAQSSWPAVPVQVDARHTLLVTVLYTYEGNPDTFPPQAIPDALTYRLRHKTYWDTNTFGHRILDVGETYGPYVLPRPAGSPSGCLYSPDSSSLAEAIARDVPANAEIIYEYPCFDFGGGDEGNGAIEGIRLAPNGFILNYAKLLGYADQVQGVLWGLPLYGYGLFCYDSAGVQVPLSTSCLSVPRIGDPMQTSVHSKAIDKIRLGWLTEENQQTVTQSGIYRILLAEVLTPGPMFLFVTAGLGEFYTVEYRRPIGPDTDMFPDNCVTIRQNVSLIQMGQTGAKTSLVCMQSHQTVVTPSGIGFTLQSMDATGAFVQITFGNTPPPPTTAPPTSGTCPYMPDKCAALGWGANPPPPPDPGCTKNCDPVPPPPPPPNGCEFVDPNKCTGTTPPTTTLTDAACPKCAHAAIAAGELSALVRGNEDLATLSGLPVLVSTSAPTVSAFLNAGSAYSAGLNWEHHLGACSTGSGGNDPGTLFGPRIGPMPVTQINSTTATLTRNPADDPQGIGGMLTYQAVAPNDIRLTVQTTPTVLASPFCVVNGQRPMTEFFASYMTQVLATQIWIYGVAGPTDTPHWIAVDAPDSSEANIGMLGAPDFPTSSLPAGYLPAQLATPAYPRMTIPMYFGLSSNGMVYALMCADCGLDFIGSLRTYLVKHANNQLTPAWDFQLVRRQVVIGDTRTYHLRMVWKLFVSADDMLHDFQTWAANGYR